MTTVPEVVLAKEAGLSYAAIGQWSGKSQGGQNLPGKSCHLKSLNAKVVSRVSKVVSKFSIFVCKVSNV